MKTEQKIFLSELSTKNASSFRSRFIETDLRNLKLDILMGQCSDLCTKALSDYELTYDENEYERLECVDTSKFEQNLKYVVAKIASGSSFTDPDFPPCTASLFDPDIDYGNFDRFKNLEWKRAGDIFKHPNMFEDGITPDDIQ